MSIPWDILSLTFSGIEKTDPCSLSKKDEETGLQKQKISGRARESDFLNIIKIYQHSKINNLRFVNPYSLSKRLGFDFVVPSEMMNIWESISLQ
jgi:hypothetical protein